MFACVYARRLNTTTVTPPTLAHSEYTRPAAALDVARAHLDPGHRAGDYLCSDFGPSSLTISQLPGISGFHNINFPSPYTTGTLIQILSNGPKPHAARLKRERLPRQSSLASDDGTTDGVTGRPIGD